MNAREMQVGAFYRVRFPSGRQGRFEYLGLKPNSTPGISKVTYSHRFRSSSGDVYKKDTLHNVTPYVGTVPPKKYVAPNFSSVSIPASSVPVDAVLEENIQQAEMIATFLGLVGIKASGGTATINGVYTEVIHIHPSSFSTIQDMIKKTYTNQKSESK